MEEYWFFKCLFEKNDLEEYWFLVFVEKIIEEYWFIIKKNVKRIQHRFKK